MIHYRYSVQTKIYKKAVLWLGNRRYDAVVKFDIIEIYSGIARFPLL